jgi:hypothetical protein
MGSRSKELWRKLRLGDRVRLTEIPTEFFQPGYYIHRETMQAYKKLLSRRRSLRVCEIDEWGLPRVQFRFRRKNGGWEFHRLLINHSGLTLVIPRTGKRKTRRGKE